MEERCVTLESTVSSFTAENSRLTEQASALQIELAILKSEHEEVQKTLHFHTFPIIYGRDRVV